MIKVTLVGNGNVSHHLQDVFTKAENIELVDVLPSRGNTPIQSKESFADVYIIAVSDDAITTVSNRFNNSGKLVVHTSGSVSITALAKGIRSGVFYPLQTFSKNKLVDFKNIPICVEASDPKDLKLLKKLATAISEKVFEINSAQRRSLHLAAVFVNNFSNHMYHIGSEICHEQEVPFEILKPLIIETAAKLDTLLPIQAQTGPARRNDKKTIKKQLEQLKNKKHKEVYQILTDSIKATYGKKL